MKSSNCDISFQNDHEQRQRLDKKLAAYLAASGMVGTFLASDVEAAVVTDSFGGVPQPVGINGEVDIDFNSDGQVDFQIDHDRYNLNGQDVDFLQIDKNDNNGASLGEDITNIEFFPMGTFPTNGTDANATTESLYVVNAAADDPNTALDESLGYYPAALQKGEMIGPSRSFDFQEGDNYQGNGTYIRVNRLIDEDVGQIDADAALATEVALNGLPDTPHWLGLGGEVRYLGMQMELNGAGNINYGWIGLRITSDADATAEVTGWAYQTVPDRKIFAGDAVPEPGTIALVAFGGVALAGSWIGRKLWRK